MKTVNLEDGLLHVETPLGVINIRVGLVDRWNDAVRKDNAKIKNDGGKS